MMMRYINTTQRHMPKLSKDCIMETDINTLICFFCKYIHVIHRNTQTQYKQTCLYTQLYCADMEPATS
jgi:hypothetical protein